MSSDFINDEYFQPGELADAIKRTERTLQRWRRLDIGPPVTHIGRLVLYRRDAVRDWLRKHEQ